MVAAIVLFPNTCRSSMTIHPQPPLNAPPSFHSLSNPQLQSHGLFSLTKSIIKSQPSNNECLHPTTHAFFRCRSLASIASPELEMGIGFEETELLFINNPDLTIFSVDSLRERVLSLHSMGLDRVDIYYLVMRRPTVLTAKEIDPLLSFLRDELKGELELVQTKRLLSSTEPRFLMGFPQKVELLVEKGVPRDKIIHVLNKLNLPKALCHRSVGEIERIMDFLEPFGGVGLILRRPAILNYDLDNQLIPRVNFLIELGGGDEDGTGKVLQKFPTILNYRADHLEAHAELLRSFAGLDDQQIFRIVLVFPGIFTASRDRKLYPRLRFLKECGLDSGDDIFKFLIRAPLFLGHSFQDNIAYKLVFLVKVGFKYWTKELAVAIGSTTRASCENLQKVIGLFLSYGLSCEDIVAMSKKQPQILQYNHDSLETKMRYLIEEMDRDIEELLVFPAFLGYKFDDRIKHRYEAMKRMKRGRMPLNELLTVSTERFTSKRKKASAIQTRHSEISMKYKHM